MNFRSTLEIFNSKGWTQRDRKEFAKLHKNWFAMSFEVTLLKYKIYGIMGAEDTINKKNY